MEKINFYEAIMMEALKMCKSHTNWKNGKGSVKSFSKSKDVFGKLLRRKMDEIDRAFRIAGLMKNSGQE
jgi:hypothetical protein